MILFTPRAFILLFIQALLTLNLVQADCEKGCVNCANDGVSCEACSSGWRLINETASCVPCWPGSWSRSGDNECFFCPSGSIPDVNQRSCEPCESGFWSSPNDSKCSLCPAGSILDIEQGGCVPCVPGLWSNSGDLGCLSCGAHCNVCGSTTICIECSYPTENINGTCVFPCPQGQFSGPHGCLDCSANCKECKSISECSVCQLDYIRQLDPATLSYTCSLEPETPEEPATQPLTAPVDEISQEAATKSTAAGMSATSMIAKSVSAGSSSAMGFGVVAKVIRNARYFSIAYSNKTQGIFTAEESSSFEINAPASLEKTDSKELHRNFVKYNVEPNFLINYWGNLMPILILSGCFAILKTFKMYLGQSKKRKILTNKIVMMFQVIAGNYLVNSLYGSFDEIVLYFILETQTCSFDSAFSWTSFICALVFLIIGLGFFGFHFKILKKYQAVKSQKDVNRDNNDEKRLEDFKTKHGYVKVLFQDFKDESLIQQSFLASFMIRASLLNILLCLFVNHPVVEACLYLTVNFIFAIFLVLKRPHEELKGAIAQYFCEIIILITYTGVLILAIMDHVHAKAEGSRQMLEKMIVTLGIVLNLGGTVFQCIDIMGTVYGVYKSFLAWRARLKIVGAPVGAASKAMGNHVDLTFMKAKKTNSDLEISPTPLKISSTPSHLKEETGGLISFSGSPTRPITINLDTETEGLTLPSNSKSLNNLLMHTEGSQSDLENGRSTITQLPLKSITVMEEKDNMDDGGDSLRIEEEQGLSVVVSPKENEKVNRRKENLSFG